MVLRYARFARARAPLEFAIRSTNELHRSSENRHSGVGKIVRCLRTSRKIYKITSRFKCIEANWALFKMIFFYLFALLSFLTFFFYLFQFSLFCIFDLFRYVHAYLAYRQLCPLVQCHFLLSVILSQRSRYICFYNKKSISGEE